MTLGLQYLNTQISHGLIHCSSLSSSSYYYYYYCYYYHHHAMTAQFPVLASLAFLPHVFLSNVNLRPAVPKNFLSSLVTSSVQQFFGFPTGRLLYSLLFLLRFSMVNSIHPYCRCVQPIPFFSVQHVLPRVVCVRIIIDFVSTADIALCVLQPWPIYCSKYFSVQRLQGPAIFLDTIQLPHG
jgi:hypothetical protein